MDNYIVHYRQLPVPFIIIYHKSSLTNKKLIYFNTVLLIKEKHIGT